MICLSDNDFLKKLAVCDLLSEAMDALETNFGEVYVLNTARHVLLKPLKNPETAKTRLGEAVYEARLADDGSARREREQSAVTQSAVSSDASRFSDTSRPIG